MQFGFTARQLCIWGMRRSGLRQVDIAERLGVTRQAIYKSLTNTDTRIASTLKSVAAAAKIEVYRLDSVHGVLLGFSHETKDRAIVTFSTQHGANIWHYADPHQCESCDLQRSCRALILDEAEERGLVLTKADKQQPLDELIRLIFTTIIPEFDRANGEEREH